MNYANVAYHLLPYNMASPILTIESNNNDVNCHVLYRSTVVQSTKPQAILYGFFLLS